ncbi:cpaT [Symbiodinium necroappetens]|uniref:CpaT protein n=1 Tax=Symbiodinium necroappetens TaxID=1628268 RepID=A0A812VL27_9DINO|nr:cpaT [Symbiodinium necroappetens]
MLRQCAPAHRDVSERSQIGPAAKASGGPAWRLRLAVLALALHKSEGIERLGFSKVFYKQSFLFEEAPGLPSVVPIGGKRGTGIHSGLRLSAGHGDVGLSVKSFTDDVAGMVKNSKLWYEIQAQYAKLQEDEVGAELFPTPISAASPSSHSPSASTAASASEEKSEKQTSRFYKDGFQRRHWVLACCSMMVMCEWLDRTVLSIAMESMKEDFKLTDAQVGLLASASLWIVPFATGCVGRLADHVPRARLIGAGVFGWAVATFATGSSPSFEVTLLCRLLAGVANCAGYPVTLALLSDYFAAEEMATAMGYYHAGSALGGLMGFAAGGVLVTSRGWRWAFWVVASPQVIVALLFCFTVPRTAEEAPPKEGVCSDVRQLLSLRPLRLLMLGAMCTGMLSGQGRFLSAFTERRHGVEAAQIGLVMGPVLGVTGVVSSFVIGHLVDRVFRRHGDIRVNLWFASFGDVLGMLCGIAAILGPSFAVLIFFTALGVVVGCFRQGVQAVVQRLGVGRRGTAQGLLETCWSIGMGIGPFLAGELSDFNLAPDCDDSCALSRALMLFGSFSLLGRAACNFAASMFLSDGIPAAEGRSNTVEVVSSEAGSDSRNPRLMRKDAQLDDGWALLLQVTANGSLLQQKQMPAVMNPAAGMGGMSTGMVNGMSMGQGNVPFATGTSDDGDEEEKKSTTTPAPTTAAATTAAATTAAPTTAAATTAAATTVAGTTKESEDKEKDGEGKASNSSGANATPPVVVSAAAPPAGSKEEAAQAQAERNGGGGGLTWLLMPVGAWVRRTCFQKRTGKFLGDKLLQLSCAGAWCAPGGGWHLWHQEMEVCDLPFLRREPSFPVPLSRIGTLLTRPATPS